MWRGWLVNNATDHVNDAVRLTAWVLTQRGTPRAPRRAPQLEAWANCSDLTS